MRLTLLLLSLTVTLKFWGQTKELNVDHYENGQFHWRGYDTCFTSIYNGKESKNCHSYGLWEYWYEDGNKMLQTFDYLSGVKYINMWLQNGKQILNNGTGFYFQIEPSGGGDSDSLVYQITDSIKHGIFTRFRSYKNGIYFLIESGHYENKKKTGIWIFRDSILNISDQSNYINDQENGEFRSFYLNGKLKEKGHKSNDQNDLTWKYYDENGKLTKECGFKSGREFGKYIEYYSNGPVKVTGQYVQVKGYETGYTEDPNDPGKMYKRKFYHENIAAMDGEWKYYNENGQLVKTKVYKSKIVKK